jgi:hypothetical protein
MSSCFLEEEVSYELFGLILSLSDEYYKMEVVLCVWGYKSRDCPLVEKGFRV